MAENLPQCADYQIVRLLGEGAMSHVYLAEQVVPVQRQVALKVLRWRLADDRVLNRFHVERQALAWFEDDRIARLLDSGTSADGRSFLAIEFVQGLPITTYCVEHRQRLRQRVELFLAACEAVHHAHQRGVLHRDLKPGHILVAHVDGRPRIKIIDFGIAKILAPGTGIVSMRTERGEVLGTPEYMAPEQVDGSQMGIDVRADIYALGAILNELLTGELPVPAELLRNRDWPSLRRTLREHQRLPMSRVTANGLWRPEELRGSLDAIVLRAGAADANDRYASVDALAADLRAWLEHRPPSVLRDAHWYALRLFVRRRRSWLIGVGLVLATALTSLSVILVERHREATRLLRLTQDAREHYVRAEALMGQLRGTPGMDVELWPRIVTEARLQLASARAGEEGEEIARAEQFLRVVEERAATDTASAALDGQKETLLQTLEVALSRWDMGSFLTSQGSRDLVASLFASSPLLEAGAGLRADILRDTVFVDAISPLLFLLTSAALIEDHYKCKAVDALTRDGLMAFMPADALDARISKDADLQQRLLRVIDPLLANVPHCRTWLEELRVAIPRPSYPSYLLRNDATSCLHALLVADLGFAHVTGRLGGLEHLRRVFGDPKFRRLASIMAVRTASGGETRSMTTPLLEAPHLVDTALDFLCMADEETYWPVIEMRNNRASDEFTRVSHAFLTARRENLDGAREALSRMRLADLDSRNLYHVGLTCEITREFDVAIAAYEATIRKQPLTPRSWCNIGRLMTRRGEHHKALLARRIGHCIGRCLDDWRFPSGRWVAEAEAFAGDPVRFERIAEGHESARDPAELQLAFRFARLTERVDGALALFRRMPEPSADMLDETWLGNCIDASVMAAIASREAGKSRMSAREAMFCSIDLLARVADAIWAAELRGIRREVVRTIRGTVERQIEVLRPGPYLLDLPREQADRVRLTWHRLRLLTTW